MSKRDSILEAAARLFVRHGFRKASVDEIARESGVSKPTLYTHFADKEALFAAVCAHVGDGMLSAAASAASGATLQERVTGILSAKFTTTFELLRNSPHAQELMETQQEAARKGIDETTLRFEALLLKELEEGVRAGELDLRQIGLNRRALVRLLMQAGHGAAYGAASADDHKRQLHALVRAILR